MRRHFTRTVRSFVKRDGRVTVSQKRALDKLLPVFSIPKEELSGLSKIFTGSRSSYLEIGFGNGDNLVKQAKLRPDSDFFGCEIYQSGIGRTLIQIKSMGIDNIRILVGDVVELVANFPSDSIDGIYIFFPDPWPKRRHHKRRLINRDFLRVLTGKMKDHAQLFMTTDDEDYAHEIVNLVERDDSLQNIAGNLSFSPRPSWRGVTRFERRAQSKGANIFEIIASLSTSSFCHKKEK